MSRELLQQALDALERVRPQVRGAIPVADVKDAIATLREALAADHLRDVAEKAIPVADVKDGIAALREALAADHFRDVAEKVAPAAPPAAPAPANIEELRHVANEWADMATSMVVWLRNIADGTSTPEAALENAEKCLAHCRKVNDTSQALSKAITAAPAPAAPAAPVPDGWVMVPRGLLRRLIAEALTFDPSLQDKEAIEQAKQLAASPAAPAAPVVREPRHVRKVGGSFQHTGTVVAEFRTTAGEPRIVLEFDAPVAGMLHVYRTDQVEPCEPVAPAAPPAARAVPLTQLWCPETSELCSKCAKTGTCEASMLQAHGIGGSNGNV